MLNIMPVPPQALNTNAPTSSFAAQTLTSPNVQDSRNAATDVQHSLELFRTQSRNKKKDDDFVKKKIRNILAELEDFSSVIEEDEDAPRLLWTPPTAFEISQQFLQARLGFLSSLAVGLRQSFGRLPPLDPFSAANQTLDLLTTRSDETKKLTDLLKNQLEACLEWYNSTKQALREGQETAAHERDLLWEQTHKLLMDQSNETRDQVYNEITGALFDDNDIGIDKIERGSIGGFNVSIQTLEHMCTKCDHFLVMLTEIINNNFGETIIAESKVIAVPSSTGRGAFIDVSNVSFEREKRWLRSLMREFNLLQHGFTIEQTLRSTPALPQKIGTYTATDRLLTPKRRARPVEVQM